jgi:CRP-like cAMP-binding protein
MHKKAQNFISSCRLFKGVPSSVTRGLLDIVEYRNVPAGTVLFQQGSSSNALYIIMEGSVKTFRDNDNGDEVVLRLLGTGDILVENIMASDLPSSVYAQTVSEASILVFPEKDIKEQMVKSQIFMDNVMYMIASCYQEAAQQVDYISLKSPLARVGHFFLRHYVEGDNRFPDISLPHSKASIASHLGMAPETLSRTLRQLKYKGVTLESKKITLSNTTSLCEFCDLDLAKKCKNYELDTCPLHCGDKRKKLELLRSDT